MDFHDSPGEAAFRAEACAFLEAHAPTERVDPHAPDLDLEAYIVRERAWQHVLDAHNWSAIGWPRAYGGRDAAPVEQIVWNQERGKRGLSENIFIVGIGMAGPTIIAHGTEEQKARYLPPMRRGDETWCQLYSEPGSGSDLASLSTRAVRDGDDWLITGQKVWTSHAHLMDYGILLARTNPDVVKHAGITFFLLDMKAAGVTLRPLVAMTGQEHFNEVFLDEVRVPDRRRVGPIGGGWKVAMTTLMNERAALGGADLMVDLDPLIVLMRRFPERAGGVVRDELAQLKIDRKALELLNARMITRLSRGESPAAEASIAKLLVGSLLSRIADLGMRLAGPEALRAEGPWQSRFLFAPAHHIAGGTDQVQKTIVAERILGMPRGPRPDRDVPWRELPRA